MKKKPKGITLRELFNETGLNRYQFKKCLRELEGRGLIKIDRWRGRKTYIDILDEKALNHFLGIEDRKPIEVEKPPESPPRRRPFSWGPDEDWIILKRG
jgi:hypothetical protein